jgi:hypothetical protein
MRECDASSLILYQIALEFGVFCGSIWSFWIVFSISVKDTIGILMVIALHL